jgi:hypothetical protein
MTTAEFLQDFINPISHKVQHNTTEFDRIKKLSNVVMIKATTFYQIYKHNVYPSSGDRLSMKDFFHACGQYFYYDKYVCTHGTEFYYYVAFNEKNQMYQATQPIINKRVWANRPATLKDLEFIVEAVTKQ